MYICGNSIGTDDDDGRRRRHTLMKKLSKHYISLPLYIPARPPDFNYWFTHLLVYTRVPPGFVFHSALTLAYLYFQNTSPECLIVFYRHRARNNIQTRPPVPDEFLNF